MNYKMHTVSILLAFSVTIQVYYLYKFIYSIPLRYEISESENGYFDVITFLRGANYISRETHTQTHLLPPHPEQTKSDNNTALTYTYEPTLDVVDRF